MLRRRNTADHETTMNCPTSSACAAAPTHGTSVRLQENERASAAERGCRQANAVDAETGERAELALMGSVVIPPAHIPDL